MSEGDKPIPVDEDYEVGYGKPPKQTRFKRGKSGNPKGRPRRFNNPYAEWQDPALDVLLEPVRLPYGGKPTTLPGIVWCLRSMRNKAIKGCPRSFKAILEATGGRGLNDIWFTVRERMREKSIEEVEREMEGVRRFIEEVLPKFGRGPTK